MYSESEWLCEQPYVLTYSDCVPGMGSEEVGPQSSAQVLAAVGRGFDAASDGCGACRTRVGCGDGAEVLDVVHGELRKRQSAATEVSASPASKASRRELRCGACVSWREASPRSGDGRRGPRCRPWRIAQARSARPRRAPAPARLAARADGPLRRRRRRPARACLHGQPAADRHRLSAMIEALSLSLALSLALALSPALPRDARVHRPAPAPPPAAAAARLRVGLRDRLAHLRPAQVGDAAPRGARYAPLARPQASSPPPSSSARWSTGCCCARTAGSAVDRNLLLGGVGVRRPRVDPGVRRRQFLSATDPVAVVALLKDSV